MSLKFKKPIELSLEEYTDTYRCLNTDFFNVYKNYKGVFTQRKKTGEVVFYRFFPKYDKFNYNYDNEKETFYQVYPILPEENKDWADMRPPVVLTDPEHVAIFMAEVLRIQEEQRKALKEKINDPTRGICN